jgi:Mce-associated membrane protein
MPTRERRLQLVKGTGGTVTRRAVVRRLPRQDDPVALLERLDEEPVSSGPPPTRRPRWTVAALAAVLALALAAAGVSLYNWNGDRALDHARQEALAAAKQTSINFVSVSASSVDRDLQRIVAGATREFKDEFVRGQAQVRAAVVENKVESTGTVLRAGLISGDRKSAVVLVAVDATVKNVKAPDGRASHYRIQVDVAREGGKWLVSRLQFVG